MFLTSALAVIPVGGEEVKSQGTCDVSVQHLEGRNP